MTRHRQRSRTPVGAGTGRCRQRGASLVEALVGILVVAIGMLGSAQWQWRLRQAVDLARQQSEAVSVAQGELEALRAFAASEGPAGVASFAAITSGQTVLGSAAGSATAYRVTTQVHDGPDGSLKHLVVDVDWPDRSGSGRNLRLYTAIGGQAPGLVLPLGHRATAGRADAVLGRHAAIPRDAHDLADGRSVFKPDTAGDQAWLFDHRSGHIVARCAAPAPKANRQLLPGDLTACVAVDEVLLAGRLRAAPPGVPDPATARATPPPLAVALDLTSAGHPSAPVCLGEAVRMVDLGTATAPRPVAVAIDATPAAQGVAAWTELGDRFWRYHCAVSRVPGPAVSGHAAAPHWSGRLRIVPDASWQLGTATGTRRVCRYSADTDASGAIDRSAEGTDALLGIEDALPEQNLLPIDGDQPCPAAAASTQAAGALPWSDGNPATVAHQP